MSIPDQECNVAPDYKEISVSGFVGGARPSGIIFQIYTERQDFTDSLKTLPYNNSKTKIVRQIEAELSLDPLQAKSLHTWLGQKIKEYETLFVTFPSPEEIESRSKRGKGV